MKGRLLQMMQQQIKVARSNTRSKSYADGNTVRGYSNDVISWSEFIDGLTEYACIPVILDEYEVEDVNDLSWKMKRFTSGYSNIFALDIDNNTEDGSQVSIINFIDRVKFKYVLSTTKSHGKDKANGKDRYRVWFPVQKSILYMEPKEYAEVLTAIGSMIGLTVDDDKLDNRDVVMGSYQPKFEPVPKDSIIYESEYEDVLDFELLRSKILLSIEPVESLERAYYQKKLQDVNQVPIETDYELTDSLGNNFMLSQMDREKVQVFCPICEAEGYHKTASAMAFNNIEDGKPNNVYCFKDEEHIRYVEYKRDKDAEGFKDETGSIKGDNLKDGTTK